MAIAFNINLILLHFNAKFHFHRILPLQFKNPGSNIEKKKRINTTPAYKHNDLFPVISFKVTL